MDTQNTSTKEVLPFDTWRSGFNTNINVAPLNTNPTMAPYNTNMPGLLMAILLDMKMEMGSSGLLIIQL
jgi:hypothetical protein